MIRTIRPFLLAAIGALPVCLAAACGSGSSNATGTPPGSDAGDAAVGTDSSLDTGSDGDGAMGTDAKADARSDAPAETYPAPFAQPPQAKNYGGPVLASPKLVPVFFAGDDAAFTAQLADFDSRIGASAYFAAAVGEYGVGPATALAPVQLTETAPPTIDDTAIQAWLQLKLDSNDPAWPTHDGNTLYILHYPAATTITLQGQSSCTGFGGYHNETQLDAAHGSADVAYAVIPRCATFGSLTGIDAVTGAESHEIAEGATDPYPDTNPAYATVNDAHIYWERVLGGGEVGDLCAQFDGSFTKFSGLAYTVQRIWSNKQAKAGHDPCQPELPGEVYFNASPVMTDDLAVNIDGVSSTVKGVELALGQSKTIEVELFSDGPTTGPWTVTAENLPMAQNLGFSINRSTGQNGDKLMLTITLKVASKRNIPFIVRSTLGAEDHLWLGIVGSSTTNDGGVEGGTDGSVEGSTDDGGVGDAADEG